MRKLSYRSRTLRNEHYPEKKKKSRPYPACGFLKSETSSLAQDAQVLPPSTVTKKKIRRTSKINGGTMHLGIEDKKLDS